MPSTTKSPLRLLGLALGGVLLIIALTAGYVGWRMQSARARVARLTALITLPRSQLLTPDKLDRARSEFQGLQTDLGTLQIAASVGPLFGALPGIGPKAAARLVIMDEPVAALGIEESRKVLRLIKQLKASGRAVIVISHNLEHVFSVADRIVVLRRGRVVGVRQRDGATASEIVHLIVGAEHL